MLEMESTVRLISFLSGFFLMLIAQAWLPRRVPGLGMRRWPANIGILVLASINVRIFFWLLRYITIPAGAIAVALWAEHQQFGLLYLLDLPEVLRITLAIVLLDLIIYLQHMVFHHVPWLWRLHRVHHSDKEFDVTTALRFHPIEIILSMVIKMTVVALLGAPAVAVLLFEMILNGMAMFNHANFRLPLALDAWLRKLVVTPDVHRIHHSVHEHELNSNYGFNLIIWDRLFGTYQAMPQHGHEQMQIGLDTWQQAPTHKLRWLLRFPWMRHSP